MRINNYGDGKGRGNGYCTGYGDGYMYGYGNDYGFGNGHGMGNGNGHGYGDGDGRPNVLYRMTPFAYLTFRGGSLDDPFDNYIFHLQVEQLVHRRTHG